ncbi:MAG: hypothetical protein HWD92_03120 [Flavobacteriia bacterium]|nr:hypothetical protein [Flavobacteriia bacterium]
MSTKQSLKISSEKRKALFWLLAAITLSIVTLLGGPVRTLRQARLNSTNSELIREFDAIESSSELRTGSYQLVQEGVNFEEEILLQINQFDRIQNVEVIGIDEYQTSRLDEYSVFTLMLNIEGRYVDLLSMLHHLEKSLTNSFIKSVEIFRFQDPTTRVNRLKMTVFIQAVATS